MRLDNDKKLLQLREYCIYFGKMLCKIYLEETRMLEEEGEKIDKKIKTLTEQRRLNMEMIRLSDEMSTLYKNSVQGDLNLEKCRKYVEMLGKIKPEELDFIECGRYIEILRQIKVEDIEELKN